MWAGPGHPRVPPEDPRVTSEEPGSPEGPRRPRRGYVEGRAQATRGFQRFLVARYEGSEKTLMLHFDQKSVCELSYSEGSYVFLMIFV